MSKNKPLKYLTRKKVYTKEQKELINYIEEARRQIETARELFDSVCDPRLIDYAIYTEAAAKSRYVYLLAEAKRLELRVDYSFKLSELSAV
jgi:hypothetical protein